MLQTALDRLILVARDVVDSRDEDDDTLQGAITELEESIPCDDCLQAPCHCP